MFSRTALSIVAIVVVAFVVGKWKAAASPGASISDETRAATLTFAPDVTPDDRAWIEAAILAARPEAQRLIAEVDGAIEIRTDLRGTPAIGLAELSPDGVIVHFDVSQLNGERAIDRNVVVLHELGHVIDWYLVPDELVAQLDEGIPRVGDCQAQGLPVGACTEVPERFADTFAKWALHGRVSLAGSGYGIAAPASLEDWGAPVGLLAAQLNAR
jgi:hypothetical protein